METLAHGVGPAGRPSRNRKNKNPRGRPGTKHSGRLRSPAGFVPGPGAAGVGGLCAGGFWCVSDLLGGVELSGMPLPKGGEGAAPVPMPGKRWGIVLNFPRGTRPASREGRGPGLNVHLEWLCHGGRGGGGGGKRAGPCPGVALQVGQHGNSWKERGRMDRGGPAKAGHRADGQAGGPQAAAATGRWNVGGMVLPRPLRPRKRYWVRAWVRYGRSRPPFTASSAWQDRQGGLFKGAWWRLPTGTSLGPQQLAPGPGRELKPD